MKSLAGILTIVLLFVNLGVQTLSAEILERKFDSASSLFVDAQFCAIEIQGSSARGIAVRIEPQKGELDDFDIDFAPGGNELKIIIKWKDDSHFSFFNWSGGKSLKLRVTVPRAIDLDQATSGGSVKVSTVDGTVRARTSGGSMTISEVNGELDAKTSGGRISLAEYTGPFYAHTSGGGINAERVRGDGTLETSGGSIDIDGCNGSFSAKTSGGGIDVAGHSGSIDAHTSGGGIRVSFNTQPGGNCLLKTSGGGITLSLPDGSNADIYAKTSGGSVNTDFPVTSTIVGKQERNKLEGKIGRGGPYISLKTSGGGIRIAKVD